MNEKSLKWAASAMSVLLGISVIATGECTGSAWAGVAVGCGVGALIVTIAGSAELISNAINQQRGKD